MSFCDWEKVPASKRTKYTPLENPEAFHWAVWEPCSRMPSTRVSTNLPAMSYICKDTAACRVPTIGMAYEMVVTGLNGFGYAGWRVKVVGMVDLDFLKIH